MGNLLFFTYYLFSSTNSPTPGLFWYNKTMETKNLDVVYFVKDRRANRELVLSLRSVAQNLPCNRVWIFGGKVQNISPDIWVKVDQQGKTKWDRVRNMYRTACLNGELTDDFILFNDDFYVMSPTSKITPYYRCLLKEHIEILDRIKSKEYARLLKNCLNTLPGDPLSYEVHTPFIFNKKNLLELMDKYPNLHCTRTMYGNLYNIGGIKHEDVKVFDDKPQFDYTKEQFLSTADNVVNINNDFYRWLRQQFPKRCRFED